MQLQEERRVTFLEKQNEALLKALTKAASADNNQLLQMVIEQQKLILKLSSQLGMLVERDALRERQMKVLMSKVS